MKYLENQDFTDFKLETSSLGAIKRRLFFFGEKYVSYMCYNFHPSYHDNVKCLKSCVFLIVCYVVTLTLSPLLCHEIKRLSHQIQKYGNLKSFLF